MQPLVQARRHRLTFGSTMLSRLYGYLWLSSPWICFYSATCNGLNVLLPLYHETGHQNTNSAFVAQIWTTVGDINKSSSTEKKKNWIKSPKLLKSFRPQSKWNVALLTPNSILNEYSEEVVKRDLLIKKLAKSDE